MDGWIGATDAEIFVDLTHTYKDILKADLMAHKTHSINVAFVDNNEHIS